MPQRSLPFWAWLLAAMLLCAVILRAYPQGDFIDYTLSAVAIGEHATPDVRPSDIVALRAARPDLAEPLNMRLGLLQAAGDVPDLVRARNGKYYTLHFFGYPLLAAPAMKLLALAGRDPLQAFLFVNLAAIFVLGLALYRWLGSARRTALALLLFVVSGGWNYLRWPSPEILSAAGLLSALILVCTEAPLAAGLIAGLAAWQTPSILLFFGAAPFLAGSWRVVPRLVPGALLAALPLLFNEAMFGTPSILGACCSSPELMSWTRLHSFFFDLNQGMLIGYPGVMLGVLVAGWRLPQQRRLLAVCLLLMLGMVVPPLMVHNWNSGATGLMRYALWAGTPLLFLFLWRWRESPRLLPLVLVLQLLATAHATRYHHLKFSPLAELVMRTAPGWYRPEAEIFRERALHQEVAPRKEPVSYHAGKQVITQYDGRSADSDELLCGKGRELWPDNSVAAGEGWRYVTGELSCRQFEVPRHTYGAAEMREHAGIDLGAGWSGVEASPSGTWTGVWSDGAQATMTVRGPFARPPRTMRVNAVYLPGNRRTRITVNGTDLGWHDLSSGEPIAVPPTAGPLTIVFVHEAPHVPTPNGPDRRKLAVFLKTLVVY